MRARALTIVVAAVLAAAAAPAAHAADPLADYTQHGSLDPCAYTPDELEAARRAITPNVRQYASDYPAALRRAIRTRRNASCDATPTPTPVAPNTTPVPATTSPAPAASAPVRHADDGVSAALIVLAAAGGLLLLLVLLAAVLGRPVRGGGRLAPTHHAWREARWRAGGVWADFRDWLSLGR